MRHSSVKILRGRGNIGSRPRSPSSGIFRLPTKYRLRKSVELLAEEESVYSTGGDYTPCFPRLYPALRPPEFR
jgi:hypothetical protein